MNSKSLFDRLLLEVADETRFQFPYSRIPQDGMVYYVCNRTGHTTSTSAARFMAITSLVSGLAKRYIGVSNDASRSTSKQREDAAASDFLKSNERCKLYNESYTGQFTDPFISLVRGEVKNMIYHELVDFMNFSSFSSGVVTGPGASCDVSGPMSQYHKMASDAMSFSSLDAQALYKACCRAFPLTSLTESVRFSMYGDKDTSFSHATFTSVPKNVKVNRGICTQPSGNMSLQLSLGGMLSDLLRHKVDIDITDQQDKNKYLAQLGSKLTCHGLSRTWRFCTIDLSEASNFPLVLIQDFFPSEFFQLIRILRCDYITVPGQEFPVQKHMCSTMGNGFTFALMTYLLSTIVRVIYILGNLPRYDTILNEKIKTWAVYGDDIIVDSTVYNGLIKCLEAFGFSVNISKSFSTGLFRESCGGDYYDGYDVRPVFVESLDTESDIYSLANRLVSWCAKHSIYLGRSISLLVDAAHCFNERPFRVPPGEDVSAGFVVPYHYSYPVRDTRYDGRRYTALLSKPITIGLWKEFSKKVRYTDIETRREFFYLYTSVIPSNREYNAPGALLFMIGGCVRSGKVAIRPWTTAPKVPQVRYTPGWGSYERVVYTDCRLRTAYTVSASKLWAAAFERTLGSHLALRKKRASAR